MASRSVSDKHYKCESNSRIVRAINEVIAYLVTFLPWRLMRFIQKSGWGLVSDDSPKGGPVKFEAVLPDGRKVEAIMDVDGTVYGFPGAPAEGIRPDEFDVWYERMAAFGGWSEEARSKGDSAAEERKRKLKQKWFGKDDDDFRKWEIK